MIWPIVLPSIELGMWLGWLTGRIGLRGRIRGYPVSDRERFHRFTPASVAARLLKVAAAGTC